jgi:hypothetical protein
MLRLVLINLAMLREFDLKWKRDMTTNEVEESRRQFDMYVLGLWDEQPTAVMLILR